MNDNNAQSNGRHCADAERCTNNYGWDKMEKRWLFSRDPRIGRQSQLEGAEVTC